MPAFGALEMRSPTVCSAPPQLVSILSAPILWRLNQPDRFDMWCLGMTFLQMVFQPLRTDNAVERFNK